MISVVTLDEVPSDLEAGSTHSVGYSITAHGEPSAWEGHTGLRFHGPSGETLNFAGVSDSKGHWNVEINLPQTGEWRWEMTMGKQVMQQLGSVSVGPGPGAAPATTLLTSLRILLPAATSLALALLATQLFTRTRLEKQPTPITDVV
jgi:hypothetical protein